MKIKLREKIVGSLEELAGVGRDGGKVLAFQSRRGATVGSLEFRKHDKRSPFYKSEKLQLLKLIEIAQAVSAERLVPILAKIIAQDTFRFQGETLRFKPEVRQQVEAVLVQDHAAIVH